MPRSKVTAIIIVLMLVLLSFAALLSYQTADKDDDKMQVVTSFYPLYYFSSMIGGDKANVHMLIPDNAEPHSWQPTPSDMVRVDEADVFVYNGAGFEPWIEDFLSQVTNPSLEVVDTSQGLTLMLSDEVVAQFQMARGTIENGPMVDVTAALGLDEATVIDAVTSYVIVDMPLVNGTIGYVRINITEPGDYRIFMLTDASFSLTTPEGEPAEVELELMSPNQFPEFMHTVFYGLEDSPAGQYTLTLSNDTHGPVELILLRWEEEGSGHEHGVSDPHFWLDPLTAALQVDRIAQAFCKADPYNASYYQSQAEYLEQRLDQLNHAYVIGLQNRTKNDIITTHEGFNYLAQRYNFTAHGAIGISGDEQPSAQDLANLAGMVDKLGLLYVYAEPIYSDAIIETVARETGTAVLVLDGVHGRTGVHADMDYFEIMYANLEQLRIGLEVTDLE